MSSLPDSPITHVTQNYLFTIVNTLDVSFFPKVIDEIEKVQLHRQLKELVVEMTAKMYEILKSMSTNVKVKHS